MRERGGVAPVGGATPPGPPSTVSPLRYAEDLRRQERLFLATHVVTEPEIRAFARAWDPLPLHLNPDAASTERFGGVIASGLHTLAIFQRLAVHAAFGSWAIVAGRALQQVRFTGPVRGGDELSGTLVVEDVVRGWPAGALVAVGGEMHSPVSPVLSLTMNLYVKERGASGPSVCDR